MNVLPYANSHYQVRTCSESHSGQLAFLCLAGFILTQAYAIPPISLPINWALWPSLPDIFGIGMLICVLVPRTSGPISEFDRTILKGMGAIVMFTALSFIITLPLSKPGEPLKYGLFSVFLWVKYFIVFWAATQIPLNSRRRLVLHRAALIAFLWLTLSAIASYFGLLDLRRLVAHLPSELAGKWSGRMLASTAWNAPGSSSIVVLVLAGLTLATTDYRKNLPLVILVILLGAVMVFLSGSRQGVIRFASFILILLARGARRHFLALIVILLVSLLIIETLGGLELPKTSQIELALSRQRYLIENPFTDEAMAGRPTLWKTAVKVLNEIPVAYFLGIKAGSFLTGYRIPEGIILAPHNMVLSLLLSGGMVALLIYVLSYGRIFTSLWRIRYQVWPMVAVTGGMLTSTFTSGIFEASLATGWFLGLYFVCLHIAGCNSISSPETKWRPIISAVKTTKGTRYEIY